MKDLKDSDETHSLLFSFKNILAVEQNKKFTFDEVLKVIISYWQCQGRDPKSLDFKPLEVMYQLEEKP